MSVESTCVSCENGNCQIAKDVLGVLNKRNFGEVLPDNELTKQVRKVGWRFPAVLYVLQVDNSLSFRCLVKELGKCPYLNSPINYKALSSPIQNQ